MLIPWKRLNILKSNHHLFRHRIFFPLPQEVGVNSRMTEHEWHERTVSEMALHQINFAKYLTLRLTQSHF